MVVCLLVACFGLTLPTYAGGSGQHRSLWAISVLTKFDYSHGPDEPVTPASLAHDLIGRVPRASSKDSVSCVGPSSPHFTVIYAIARDDVDRATSMVPLLRQAVYDASAFMDAESRRTSPSRARLKVLCDAAGEVTIASAVLGIQRADASAASIISSLQALGYSNAVAKYIVFYDDCVDLCSAGGQGTIRSDDRASGDNTNNSGLSYAIDYADLLLDAPAWSTILHEVIHNMGGVQLSAPHTTGAFHCNDGNDVMCYDDNGPSSAYSESACLQLVLDCGGDDYFSPNPAAGSYLSNHWNIAASYNGYVDHD